MEQVLTELGDFLRENEQTPVSIRVKMTRVDFYWAMNRFAEELQPF